MTEIINIDHESGDFSEWDSIVVDGGDLSIASGAALGGSSYGMQCVIDDTHGLYGDKSLGTWPGSATSLRIRFYLDPNGLTMANNDTFALTNFLVTVPMRFYLKFSGGNYQILVNYYGDGGLAGSDTQIIADAEHYLEVLIAQATNNSSADGSYQYWIDGALQDTQGSIDNYDIFNGMTTLRIGGTTSIDAGTSGTFYIDQIVARNDDTEIGPYVPPTGADPISTTLRLALGLGG
jgi:hypothetical protein